MVVKSLKSLEKYFRGYLPQIEFQMEALDNLAEIFTMTTATTMATGAIPTSAESPRMHRYAPGTRVPTHPPRVHNSTTLLPALVD